VRMTPMPRSSRDSLVASALVLLLLLPSRSLGAPLAARVAGPVDDSRRVMLPGVRPPFARPEMETGRLAPETRLEGVTLSFARTAAQDAELADLISAQQDPTSPLHRRWLTPEEFGARFGAAPADVAVAAAWLARHGLAVDGVSRARDSLRFSGSVGQVEAALGTELHTYRHGDRTDFAPSTEPSIPAALSPLVGSVRGLTSARPRPHLRQARPQFTSGQTSSHFLTPADVAVIYDIDAAYQDGVDGTGQEIAVVGQSSVSVTDVEHFQAAAGVAVRDPVLTLVPSTGTATAVSGDQAESDLDLEYTSAIATGATIDFVYVGNDTNTSVWDALQYAVDNDLAPVISMSYGICEPDMTASDYASIEPVLAQAAVQGQSVVVSSGDDGSTDCYSVTGLSPTVQQSLAVDFPASSQYVTAIGGTEFSTAAVDPKNTTYWKAATGGDILESALSYIPEQVWNDGTTSSIAAGGGGASTYSSRPSWQAGVVGIPSGSARLVPDVSLDASAENAPYLYCSSDSSTGVTGSCSHGFRDSSSTYLTVAGGTSFGAPIFAGMLALVNEKLGEGGLGVAASTLYSLASSGTTYASAFHDITLGGNNCQGGTACTAGATSYLSTAGYDEASGLGSVDFYNLLGAWPGASALAPSVTTISAGTTSPGVGVADPITITVASGSSNATAVPTGDLSVAVDGTIAVAALALVGGSASYSYSPARAGTHVVSVAYAGDATYRHSIGHVTLVAGAEGFTVSAESATVASGASGASAVTVTPTHGYTGTITWTVAANPVLKGGCLSLPDTVVSGAGAVTATLTIDASSSLCGAASLAAGTAAGRPGGRGAGRGPLPARGAGVALAALALALGVTLGRRRTPLLVSAAAALALAACGGSASTGTGGSDRAAAKGTYTVSIVGRDKVTPSVSATATMTLTVD